jgi:uncharacterized protein (DUF1778 family)
VVSVTLYRQKKTDGGKEKIGRKYTRKRTETLSLRLTAEEKDLLRSHAQKRGQSLTSYILLSALQYSNAEQFRPLLKSLDSLRAELLALNETQNSDALADALEKQDQIYDEVLAAIRCR